MHSSLDIASQLTRAKVLLAALTACSAGKTSALNYLEIGTAFSEKEGLSTLLAVQFLHENTLSGKVVSIDNNANHILMCRDIIFKHNPSLLERVDFLEGDSLNKLPNALRALQTVEVAFIDGGGDPLVNLCEFFMIFSHLSQNGIIVIDDVSFLAPTVYYHGRRDFGKAQLIYPLLLLVETLNYRLTTIERQTKRPRNQAAEQLSLMLPANLSGVIADSRFLDLCEQLQSFAFIKVGSLLLFSTQAVIHETMEISKDSNLSTVNISNLDPYK
jgi:predicted O-methyltransferase YrrM